MNEIEEIENVLAVVVRSLVAHPGEVVIEVDQTSRGIRFLITPSADDAGMVVGKNGNTIRHIRSLVGTIGHKMKLGNLAVDVHIRSDVAANDRGSAR